MMTMKMKKKKKKTKKTVESPFYHEASARTKKSRRRKRSNWRQRRKRRTFGRREIDAAETRKDAKGRKKTADGEGSTWKRKSRESTL